MILQHFFSNLLSKITSLKCNTTLLYRRAKMLFGPYFHEKTWSAASYCSLKVTKPPESFEIEAKYTKDGRKINLNLIYFLCTSPTYPSHCVRCQKTKKVAIFKKMTLKGNFLTLSYSSITLQTTITVFEC